MALKVEPSIVVNEVKNAVMFAGVDDPKAPRFKSNVEKVAWEWYLASEVMYAAKMRVDRARKLAIETELIFDQKKNPELRRAPGTYQLFRGRYVAVQLQVAAGREMVNHDEFVKQLRLSGVKDEVLKKCIDKAKGYAANAHTFSAFRAEAEKTTEDVEETA